MHLKSLLRWLPVAVLPALTLFATAVAPPNLPEALEAQLELARSQPDDAAIFNDLGNLLALAGDYEDAEDAYLHALSLEPAKATARYNLGLLYDRQGKYRRALNQFQRLVKEHPTHAWGHYQLGVQHSHMERDERAVQAFARAFTLNPELTFAEVNPHVLDNPHYTRALMRMDKEKATGQLSPKQFDEPSRISAILVPGPAELMDEMEDERDQMAEGDGEDLDTGDAEVVQVEAAGNDRSQRNRRNQAEPVARTAQPAEPGAEGTGGETRTLSVTDLDPNSRSGQAGRSNSRRRANNRRLPVTAGRPVTNPRARRGTVNPSAQPDPGTGTVRPRARGRVRYRPGTNSTGRLDIELIPVGPGAAVGDSPAG